MNELQLIQSKIYEIRGQRVMLDKDSRTLPGRDKKAERSGKKEYQKIPGRLYVSVEKRRV